MPILKRNNIARAGIFGSYARGSETKTSDIDLLVEIKGNMSLLRVIKIKQEIEQKLKKRVDLVEYSTLKPLLKERILQEEVRIL